MRSKLQDRLICLMLDMWTHKGTHRKFLGMRVSFVDETFIFHTTSIALREFKLTLYQSEHKMWSKVLEQRVLDLLAEFSISPENIIGVTSDAGSDIKKIFQKWLPGKWFWCIRHLLQRCAISTYSLPTLKILVKQIREVYHYVMGIRNHLLAFMEFTTACGGLKLFRSERWLGICETLERLIAEHDVLCRVYVHFGDTYPFASRKELLMQYLKMYRILALPTKISQNSVPDCAGTLRELYKALSKLDPAAKYIASMKPEVKLAMEAMDHALRSRFFYRYDTSPTEGCLYQI